MPTDNPYRSPAVPEPSPAASIAERIALDGTVTEDDVVAMLPTPWIVRFLQVLAVTVCLPMFLLFSVFLFTNDKDTPDAIPILGVQAFMVGVGWFAFGWLGRRRRSRRLLQTNAGMLGPLRGYLDEFGLNWHPPSSTELHRFSWTALRSTIVTKHGIALVPLSSPDGFIAIPTTCIENYDAGAIKPLVRRWHRDCTAPPIYMIAENWSERPAGSVTFRKAAVAHASEAFASNSFATYATIVGVLAASFFVLRAIVSTDYALPLMVLASILFSTKFDRRPRATPALPIGYWGWLTADGGRSHSPYGSGDFRWSDATAIEVDDQHFTVTFAPEDIFQLEKRDLDDGEFETVRIWLTEKIPATPGGASN